MCYPEQSLYKSEPYTNICARCEKEYTETTRSRNCHFCGKQIHKFACPDCVEEVSKEFDPATVRITFPSIRSLVAFDIYPYHACGECHLEAAAQQQEEMDKDDGMITNPVTGRKSWL